MKLIVLCIQRHAVSIGLPLVRTSRKTASQQCEQIQGGCGQVCLSHFVSLVYFFLCLFGLFFQ